METFMERIIETDRRAREVIEQALSRREPALAEARTQAQAELDKRAEALRLEMEEIDRRAEDRRKRDAQAADEEYLTAKHALDAAFEQQRAAWLDEIFSRAARR